MPYWSGSFLFGKKRSVRHVSLIKPKQYSLKHMLKCNNKNVNNSTSIFDGQLNDFHDSTFLHKGTICSDSMKLFQIISYKSLQSSLSTLGMQCAYIFQVEVNYNSNDDSNNSMGSSNKSMNLEFMKEWHRRQLCPILSTKFKYNDSHDNNSNNNGSNHTVDIYIALVPNCNDGNNETYALLLESPGLSHQDPHHSIAVLNTLLAVHFDSINTSPNRANVLNLNVNREILRNMKVVESKSNNNLYSNVLENELSTILNTLGSNEGNIVLGVTRRRRTNTLQIVKNTAKDAIKNYLCKFRESNNEKKNMEGRGNTNRDYASSCDDVIIDAIRKNVFSCVNNVLKLSSKHINTIKQMSGKGSGIKYCSGESMENNHLDNNNRINNSTALSSNLKKITPNNNKNNVHINKSANGAPKRSLHRVNGANGAQSATTTAAATQNLFKTTLKNKRSSMLSTGNNKKSVTSKAQAALAGATERDRARRRERRKRGGIKKKHKDAHKDTNIGGNVDTFG
eukprot:g5306.t1